MSEEGERREQAILERLEQVVRPEAIPPWLNTPNQALGGLRPSDLLAAEDFEPLERMLDWIESGVA